MCSGRHVERNLRDATRLVREAAQRGASYVQTPEVTTLMELDRERLFDACRREEDDAALAHFRALARELGIWLHIGSIAVKVSERGERTAELVFVCQRGHAVGAAG